MSNKLNDLMSFINLHLSLGDQVRLYTRYDTACTHVKVTGGETPIIYTVDEVIAPGYLNCTRPGTPSRVIAIEDNGLFGAKNLEGKHNYCLCMSHRYNSHDDVDDEGTCDYGSDRDLENGYEAGVGGNYDYD